MGLDELSTSALQLAIATIKSLDARLQSADREIGELKASGLRLKGLCSECKHYVAVPSTCSRIGDAGTMFSWAGRTTGEFLFVAPNFGCVQFESEER